MQESFEGVMKARENSAHDAVLRCYLDPVLLENELQRVGTEAIVLGFADTNLPSDMFDMSFSGIAKDNPATTVLAWGVPDAEKAAALGRGVEIVLSSVFEIAERLVSRLTNRAIIGDDLGEPPIHAIRRFLEASLSRIEQLLEAVDVDARIVVAARLDVSHRYVTAKSPEYVDSGRRLRIVEFAEVASTAQAFLSAIPSKQRTDLANQDNAALRELTGTAWSPVRADIRGVRGYKHVEESCDVDFPTLTELVKRSEEERWNIPGSVSATNLRLLNKVDLTTGIAITFHNDEVTCSDVIASVLDQTLPFSQIILVDVASTDDTTSICEYFEARYPRILLIRLTSNVGPGAARDLGMSKLQTDTVSHLDGDDLIWPTKNAAEVDVLERKGADIAFSDILVLDGQQEPWVAGQAEIERYSGPDLLEHVLRREQMLPRDMTMTKSAYQSARFDYVVPLWEDWDVKVRLAAQFNLKWARSNALCGTIYRRRPTGLSQAPVVDVVKRLLHELGRLRELYAGPCREFNTIAQAALKPYPGNDIRHLEMLIGYVGDEHYQNLRDRRLVGYDEYGEVIANFAAALINPREDLAISGLPPCTWEGGYGLAPDRKELIEGKYELISRIESHTLQLTVHSEEQYEVLRLSIFAPVGEYSITSRDPSGRFGSTMRRHVNALVPVVYELQVLPGEVSQTFDLFTTLPYWLTGKPIVALGKVEVASAQDLDLARKMDE